MKNPFHPGDIKYYSKIVTESDTAVFGAGMVHPVYATFALGRDAEWACRLFVLEMKEEDEEGIGTFLNIEHVSPALLGSSVIFASTLKSVKGNSVVCTFEARVDERVVARGETGQKILKKQKLDLIFDALTP